MSRRVPWWRFWNTHSGAPGGMIASFVVLSAVYLIIMFAIYWFVP